MNKSRGVLVAVVVLAIAGVVAWWLHAREPHAGAPATRTSATNATTVSTTPTTPAAAAAPARVTISVRDASGPIAGATVRVSDVGTVTRGAPDRTMLVTGSGRDAVVMTIAQQIGANIVSLKRGLDSVLADLAKTLPAGIKINRVYDLAEFVEESIASVRDAILIGGILAIVRERLLENLAQVSARRPGAHAPVADRVEIAQGVA